MVTETLMLCLYKDNEWMDGDAEKEKKEKTEANEKKISSFLFAKFLV